MTVLLALHSNTIASGIVNHLRGLECDEVIHAKADDQVRQQLGARDVDLLFVGWRLKRAAGVTIVRELREQPAGEALPVIMVSSHADRERVMRAIMVGVDGYLLRPFERRALEARVKQAMVRRRLMSQRSASEEIEA